MNKPDLEQLRKKGFLARNEYLVAKAVNLTCDADDSLLVSMHCEGMQVISEDDAEYHIIAKMTIPKVALEGSQDAREAILGGVLFSVLEVNQEAITKQMRQVCEVSPKNDCRILYSVADKAAQNTSPPPPSNPSKRKKKRW
jgi:hypothetical protein